MAIVKLKFTGNVHTRMGRFEMPFDFAGNNLRDLLNVLLAQYDLRDLLLGDDGRVRPYARLIVNGRFSELLGELDAPVQDGDTVVLVHPYAVAF